MLPALSESQLLTDGLSRRKSATPMPAEIAIEAHVSPDFAVTNVEQAFGRLYTLWQIGSNPRSSVPRGCLAIFMVRA